MADTHPEGAGAGAPAPFDLSQFYQIFFDEAAENLEQMEHMLLHVDLANANDEQLNAIFRCAHSIKGGAATFGFADIAELTHQMESLLDRVRRRELSLTPDLVDVLLDAADLSRELLTRHQEGENTEPPSTAALVSRISDLVTGSLRNTAGSGFAHSAQDGVLNVASPAGVREEANPLRRLALRIGPMQTAEAADEVADLLCSMPNMVQRDELPVLQANVRALVIETRLTDDELRDLLAFHLSDEQLGIDHEEVIAQPDSARMRKRSRRLRPPNCWKTNSSACSAVHRACLPIWWPRPKRRPSMPNCRASRRAVSSTRSATPRMWKRPRSAWR